MPKQCIVCESSATLYCSSDDAFLCAGCDEQVHSANVLAAKHHRVRVCELCCDAAATVYCVNDTANLCASCDESSHAGVVAARHQRIPVSSAAQCCAPKALDEQSACADVTEEDSMFAVPEVALVPPGVDDFPQWGDAVSGPLDAKSLLGKEYEQDLDIFDMDPSWLDRLDMGFDDLTQSILDGVVPEFGHAAPLISDESLKCNAIPEQPAAPTMLDTDPFAIDMIVEDAKPVLPVYRVLTHPSQRSMQHHAPAFIAAVPEQASHEARSTRNIASFVPPSMRPVDAQTLSDRADDRKQRLARYREKKKNRQFKKTIRYASRKAYAEVRPRVKGRFARKDEVAAMRAAGLLPVV